MHILFVVPYVPNLIRVRSYNLIHHLAKKGHSLTVMTLWTNDDEREDIQKLTSNPVRVYGVHMSRWKSFWNCLWALPKYEPLQANYSWQPDLTRNFDSVLGNGVINQPIDVVHVEHLRGAKYALYINSNFDNIPVVWDSVDCISYLFEQASQQSYKQVNRLITRFELPRTRKYEKHLADEFDHILMTSQLDKEKFIELKSPKVPKSPISVIPNGVDWEYFGQELGCERETSTILFSGKMSYHANITMVMDLVNKIMPKVWKERPDVRLMIVGKDPPDEILALSDNNLITITGTVKDLRPYLQKASVSVVPMIYGAGSQLKILEAMASSTPVITTSKAASAYNIIHGRDVLVAQDDDEFAKSILLLLDNPDFGQQIGQAGRCYVEKYHQWAMIADRLEGIYHEVIHAKV